MSEPETKYGNGKEMQKQDVATSFAQKVEQAKYFIKSGFLPAHIKTPEQAVMIMQVGSDLGLKATEALRSISVIQGVPCMKAQLLLGLCYRTNQVEDCKIEELPGECRVTLKRKGQKESYTASFSMKDAESLGLSVRDNWRKQAKTMLRWRAISAACRVVFPDAISGLYTEEEIADEVELVPDTDSAQKGDLKAVPVVPAITHDTPPQSSSNSHASGKNDELNASVLPDESLTGYVMKAGKYTGRTLLEIITDVTAEGKMKGYEYLKWIVANAKDPDLCVTVERFLNYARKSEIVKD